MFDGGYRVSIHRAPIPNFIFPFPKEVPPRNKDTARSNYYFYLLQNVYPKEENHY